MGPLDPSRLGAFLMRQIPPSDGEVVERGNVLPLGTYRTPDGRETTTFAFPQPMREGLDALAYALGYRQDPNAPAGYVTHDALNKGGQGLAESAMVGGIAAPKPRNGLAMGIKAYHNSNKEFNKFSMDHVGTGHGGSLEGRGLYFSSKPNDKYGKIQYRVDIDADDTKLIDFDSPVHRLPHKYAEALSKNAKTRIDRDYESGGFVARAATQAKNQIGNLHGDSNKSDIVGFGKTPDEARADAIRKMRVSDILVGEADEKLSAALLNAGIKGIKRKVGDETIYTIFDDQLITIEDILAANANPLAGAVPLAWSQPQEQPQGPMMGETMGRPIPPEEEAQRQALIRYLQGVQ